MARHNDLGHAAELAACRFLESQGLVLLQRNYRVAGGELDLVMSDGPVIVFVEVRARDADGLAHPAETITARKRSRLRHAAQRYLQDIRRLHDARTRFDVVCVLGDPAAGGLQWIKRAFEA